ncbi:AIR synthase-related protein [Bdellovibrionota bacterium FG-2]
MFCRIELAIRPEFADPASDLLFRKLQLAHPDIAKRVRWMRLLPVFWVELPSSREEMIPAVIEIFWDRVLGWVFTGNLIPSAAGKDGGIQDLITGAPHRPGAFWALERRFRPGVTDTVARTSLEAFEIVLGRKMPDARAASGSLLLLEGPQLTEEMLASIARDILCNELIETWTLVSEHELQRNDRFHAERVKRDLPRIPVRGSAEVQHVSLEGVSDAQLERLSREKVWALSIPELRAIRAYFSSSLVLAARKAKGLSAPTDVELEVLAQTWSEHCKHKIFNAKVKYFEDTKAKAEWAREVAIPKVVNSLFDQTIVGTTELLPKNWLISVFKDNAGIIAFDEEDAICVKVETHNTPSALDPYGGALTGIVGVNRDILGCGLGAKPIFNTDVFCVAPLDYAGSIPDRLMHPRRILDGIRRGVEDGGNQSGIPTINGALVFDERYLGKPLVFCGSGGILPRVIEGRRSEVKEIRPGDRVCMLGGRIGKDGIHGATFSSLALDDLSPLSAVQLGDPLTQKRMTDFLLEARNLGLIRCLTDNGAGGLSSSVGEMARFCGEKGGARIDVSLAKTKYPGLKPFELVVSESQERMTVAVSPDALPLFETLAERRGVEVSDLGEFLDTGLFDILYEGKLVASLDLKFLHDGVPQLELEAEWPGVPEGPKGNQTRRFEFEAADALLSLLGSPNIASKEWLIRQYDHEVQGMSVVKPLHTVFSAQGVLSGPNDAAVIKPKTTSSAGMAVGCGINPKLSDIDPFLMACSAVDEAVRNVLCVGGEFGRPESVLALIDNFCWPDPQTDRLKAAWLVRACYGMQQAALALSAPLISGKDSMKNDFRGMQDGKPVTISVPPTLLITAIAKVRDIAACRTSDFKSTGDAIFLLGGKSLGLWGSEFERVQGVAQLPGFPRVGIPNWEDARRLYGWLGGEVGKEQSLLKSLHDISDGGLLVAVVEGMLARGLGAYVKIPDATDAWEFCFGEGFHSFITTVADSDAEILEMELRQLGIGFRRLGSVTQREKLEVMWSHKEDQSVKSWSVPTKQLRVAWQKGGYWE